MSIGPENALALGVDAFELAAPDGPTERGQDDEPECDGQWNEDEKNEIVHLLEIQC